MSNFLTEFGHFVYIFFYTVNKNNTKNAEANYSILFHSILGTVCQYLTIVGAKKNSYHTPNSTVWCSLIRLFLSSRSFQYVCVYKCLWQISSSQWDSSPAAPMCSAFITEDTDPASLLRAALYVPSYTCLFSFSLYWYQACWFWEPVIIIVLYWTAVVSSNLCHTKQKQCSSPRPPSLSTRIIHEAIPAISPHRCRTQADAGPEGQIWRS